MGRDGGGRHFSGIVKANLTGCHAGCFVEVGPGGIDYCDVIFFVAWGVSLVDGLAILFSPCCYSCCCLVCSG